MDPRGQDPAVRCGRRRRLAPRPLRRDRRVRGAVHRPRRGRARGGRCGAPRLSRRGAPSAARPGDRRARRPPGGVRHHLDRCARGRADDGRGVPDASRPAARGAADRWSDAPRDGARDHRRGGDRSRGREAPRRAPSVPRLQPRLRRHPLRRRAHPRHRRRGRLAPRSGPLPGGRLLPGHRGAGRAALPGAHGPHPPARRHRHRAAALDAGGHRHPRGPRPAVRPGAQRVRRRHPRDHPRADRGARAVAVHPGDLRGVSARRRRRGVGGRSCVGRRCDAERWSWLGGRCGDPRGGRRRVRCPGHAGGRGAGRRRSCRRGRRCRCRSCRCGDRCRRGRGRGGDR